MQANIFRMPYLLQKAGPIVLGVVPAVATILLANFLLLQFIPGDAVDVLAGESGSLTVETMAALRHQFGLDLPIIQHFGAYLTHLAHFDLGYSLRFNMPVAQLIGERLPATCLLLGTALAIALALGILGGLIAAQWAGRWPDYVISGFALVFYSIPGFWIGLMMIVLFSVKLGWLPSGGGGTIGSDLSGLPLILDKARYLVMPTAALAMFFTAIYMRLVRASVLDIRTQDFVRTAAAKGLPERLILFRHILRNALLPVTTMTGLHLGNLFGGAVVVETVFGWPGLGRLAFEAVMGRDLQVLLGILLLSSILVIVINAGIDVIHAWIDPRIGDLA